MAKRSILGGRSLFGVALWLGTAAIAQDPSPGIKTLTPAQLDFIESPRAPGVLTAPLLGTPSKPEYYVFRAKYPARTVNRPHHHPGDEELTVISGVLYFGLGEMMDTENTRAYPAGSYLRVPAGSVHYLFTKDEIAEVEVRGMGPRQNIFAK